VETVVFIPAEEAAVRLAIPLDGVRALIAAGALEARETEAGLAVAEDDVADPAMLTLTSMWARQLRRTVRRHVLPGETLQLLREVRGEYDSGDSAR
jgi:hypothetical protein